MKMRSLFFSVLAMMASASVFAGDLISVTPNDGNGARIVRVSFDTGNPGERATNLLLDKTIDENLPKKWCTANFNDDNQIDVIFELSDYYDLDKFVIQDCQTQENDANIVDYQILVGEEDEWGYIEWTVVVDKTEQGDVDVKIDEITPTKTRHVKLTTTNTPLIRVYGFEIYGTKSKESAHPANLISVNKPILKYYDLANENINEGPVGIFDGNTESAESKWCFVRGLDTDSLKYVVVDLLDQYDIKEFKLYDCRYLEYDDNITGYNIYVSETMPDLDLITSLEDENTCWTKVVDAYEKDRLLDDVKEDLLASAVKGRYVKLEVPMSCTPGEVVRLFEFQIYGDLAGSNIENEQAKTLNIHPTILDGATTLTLNNSAEGVFSIYSLNGQLMKNQSVLPMGTVEVNLPSGVYVAKMTANGADRIVKLISK